MRDLHKDIFNFLIHILSPLICGGIIYISWRDTNLLMFDWFRKLHISDIVFELRYILFPLKEKVPHWILYNLPDGCWVWSTTSAFTIIWKKIYSIKSGLWISSAIILGFFTELGQLFGWLSGTFDYIDLLCMILSYVLPYIILRTELVHSDNSDSLKKSLE